MKNIFYRQRFLESPTLIFFMACVMISSFAGSFLIDFFVALWLITIFVTVGILVKMFIFLIPVSLQYSFITMIAITIMSISYQVIALLTPNLSVIYHLVVAMISALAIVIAYLDHIFYNSSLVSTLSITVSITTFLILFATFLIFFHYAIATNLMGHTLGYNYAVLPFWLTLAGRLTLLSLMLFLLKHLFRREY